MQNGCLKFFLGRFKCFKFKQREVMEIVNSDCVDFGESFFGYDSNSFNFPIVLIQE